MVIKVWRSWSALYMNEFEKHKIKEARVLKIREEARNVKTFELDVQLDAVPGQFIMLWLPRVAEKPFSLTKAGNTIEVAVKKRGSFTEKLFQLSEGSYLGVRGPYGKGFSWFGVKKACIVSGGIGIAALMLLAEELAKNKVKIDFIAGFNSKEDILFKERIKRTANLYITTDDGSFGAKGLAHEILPDFLQNNSYDKLYCCGPERMMVKVLELCKKFDLKAEFAVERYMKCAVGLCGHCCLDEWLVCRDGPVFSSEQLMESKEFGKFCYTKSGKRIPIQ